MENLENHTQCIPDYYYPQNYYYYPIPRIGYSPMDFGWGDFPLKSPILPAAEYFSMLNDPLLSSTYPTPLVCSPWLCNLCTPHNPSSVRFKDQPSFFTFDGAHAHPARQPHVKQECSTSVPVGTPSSNCSAQALNDLFRIQLIPSPKDMHAYIAQLNQYHQSNPDQKSECSNPQESAQSIGQLSATYYSQSNSHIKAALSSTPLSRNRMKPMFVDTTTQKSLTQSKSEPTPDLTPSVATPSSWRNRTKPNLFVDTSIDVCVPCPPLSSFLDISSETFHPTSALATPVLASFVSPMKMSVKFEMEVDNKSPNARKSPRTSPEPVSYLNVGSCDDYQQPLKKHRPESVEDPEKGLIRKVCKYKQCEKVDKGGGFCKSHGGGRRCKMDDCSRSARGSSGLCISHGGGPKCAHVDCTKSARTVGGFCKGHGGGKRCKAPGCQKAAREPADFCIRHGGGLRCSADGCQNSVRLCNAFCKLHSQNAPCF